MPETILPAPVPNERWLTIQQVADHLQVSEKTVRRLIATGELRGRRISKQLIRIDPASLGGVGSSVSIYGGDAA